MMPCSQKWSTALARASAFSVPSPGLNCLKTQLFTRTTPVPILTWPSSTNSAAKIVLLYIAWRPCGHCRLAAAGSWEHQCQGSKRRSEEHTSELQSLAYLVCRLLLEKKKKNQNKHHQARVDACTMGQR